MEACSQDLEGWTRPRKSFVLRKAGSGSSQPPRQPINSGLCRTSLPASGAGPAAHKRRNPFSTGRPADNNKKQKLELSDWRPSVTTSSSGSDSAADCLVKHLGEDKDNRLSFGGPVQLPSVTNDLSKLPVDWSLKTRMKFVSTSSLNWSQSLSTAEEASGVTGGVRCLDLSQGDHCLDTSMNAQFHAGCLYWQHPSLPVPGLFPRFSASGVQRSTSGANLTLSADMQRGLHTDYIMSLNSLYHLLKARQCPYFYVCATSFTCLFRAAGISGHQQITALISPTTSGMRATLRKEDVGFSLPLYSPTEPEEVDNKPKLDSANEWLESLGIEADSLPGLASANPKQRTQETNIDGKAESMVYVEGVECQSLLDYLVNAKLTSGNTVAQAGLPPTLLSPVAFHGATLRHLRVKQAVLGGKGGLPKQHMVELSGAVLPHAVHYLCQLAGGHQPQYSVNMQPLDETVCFSMLTSADRESAPSVFASASLKDCGLSQQLVNIFCQGKANVEDKESSHSIVRNVVFKNGHYEWNTDENQ